VVDRTPAPSRVHVDLQPRQLEPMNEAKRIDDAMTRLPERSSHSLHAGGACAVVDRTPARSRVHVDLQSRQLEPMNEAKRIDREFTGRIATLSGREKEILALFARGQSAKRIAIALGLSPRTVEAHSASIIRKLAAENRMHAVAMAIDAGVVHL